MIRFWHYDGQTALRHEGELLPRETDFDLRFEDGRSETLNWHDLVHTGDKAGNPVFGRADMPGWRLGFDGPIPEPVHDKLPDRHHYGRWIDRIGLWPAAGAFAVVSAAALYVGLKAPDLLAPLVPASVERRLGDAMVGDFGGRVCNGPGGQEALDALVRRIERDPGTLKVRVVNIAMVNAVALPGENVFVFRGLLQQAQSPDELAGVIGHEIGHVRNRDVMQALLRQMGLSILLGGADSNIGGGVNALISATYSREAEARADSYSIRAMQRANVTPLATAGFFARLAEMEEAVKGTPAALGYLASHPVSASRERAFKSSARKGAAYTPAITPEQWRALVESCKNDPDVEKDDGLLF